MSDTRKTLLPELLPTPAPSAAEPPRARVAARARAMLDRWSGLKRTAGAAVLAACGGYGVVDPLPPPPAQCGSPADQLSNLTAYGNYPVPTDAGSSAVQVFFNDYQVFGVTVLAVRVTGGDLIDTQDMSKPGSGGGTNIAITIAPTGDLTAVTFEVDFGCGPNTTTKRYGLTTSGTSVVVVNL